MKHEYLNCTDQEIWNDFKKGIEAAYASMYTRYVNLLFNYGRHICPDEDLVKDCIQNLFLELWNKRQNLADTTSIKYYLFKSLRRRLVDELMNKRKNYVAYELSEEYSFQIVLPHEVTMITDQASQEQKQNLLKAINHLTKRQKEALFLLYFDNLSYEEVATIMQLKTRTIYNLIHTAISELRKHIHKIHLLLFISDLFLTYLPLILMSLAEKFF